MAPGLLNGSDRGLSDEEHSEQGCGTHHALTASDRRIDDRNGSRCVEIVVESCPHLIEGEFAVGNTLNS